jgi:hypothetical protein
LAKPHSHGRIDPEKIVLYSLLDAPKKPVEIEKYLHEKAKRRYENRFDLTEQEKQKQIARDTIKRRFIEYILEDLQERGEVAQEKPLGKYFLTEKVFENPSFYASIFSRNALSKLLELSATSMSPFANIDMDNLEDDYMDASSIFAFANDIGAFLTYTMTEAMNPEHTKHLQTGAEKDKSVLGRIENAIESNSILLEFCKWEIIRRGQAIGTPVSISESLPPDVQEELLRRQKSRRYYDPHNPKWSRYEIDEVNYRKAMKAFATAYPHAYEVLEQIRRGVPRTVQYYKTSYIGSLKNDRMKRKKRSKYTDR